VVQVEHRYSDAPPARLRVLTADAFAAAKLGPGSTAERPVTSNDVGDERARLIGPFAPRVFTSHGPFGEPPAAWVFERQLDEGGWMRSLGHQTQLPVSAREAIAAVREAWSDAA
jgi:hypothetical protein